jgi:hypothetical protein
MPGKDPYNGTDNMSPSSTAVCADEHRFSCKHRSRHATFQHIDIRNENERRWRDREVDGHILVVHQYSARVDDARDPCAIDRPEIAPLARAAVGTGLPVDDRVLGAARKSAQRFADRERAVVAVRALEESGQHQRVIAWLRERRFEHGVVQRIRLRTEIDIDENPVGRGS